MPLYSLLLGLALLAGSPFWLSRMLTRGRYRAGLRERLGHIRPALRWASSQPTVWLHAVSVGELLAASGLIRVLQEQRPDTRIVLSTTTEAGQRLARERFPELQAFYLPLDFGFLVRRLMRVLQPEMLILMESELWPNLIREAARCGCAVVVANARISDRSFPRYLRLRRLWQPILRPVSLFLAQSPETAERLRVIGVAADKIHMPGNLKFDTPEPQRSPMFHAVAAALPADALVLVAGSTLPGEEESVLAAWPQVLAAEPAAVLLLAPRHPDRFPTVADLVRERRLPLLRASALAPGQKLAAGTVLLLDSIGDLAALYALATVAFVGGSLVAAGGHNPLEPARFAVATVMGPSIYNFREIVGALAAAHGIVLLRGEADLPDTLVRLMGGKAAGQAPELASGADLGARAQAIFRAQAGAAERSVALLLPLLRERTAHPAP